MILHRALRPLTLLGLLLPFLAQAQKPAEPKVLPKEEDFYQILRVPEPDGVQLEVGGLALLPDGRLGVATRRGDIWLITNPAGELSTKPIYKRFATGLHEALGLAWHNGALYTAQRGELTRLEDSNGDGVADKYITVTKFPISGNYHEYAYGPVFDKDGNAFITLNVGFFDPLWYLGVARVPYRGWCMRITPEGKLEPWAAGVRSPAGVFVTSKGEVIYGENQGDYIGSGWITELNKGDFAGHPAGLNWASLPGSPVKARYADVDNAANEETMWEARPKVPGLKTPAVWFPHGIMGISTCGIYELPPDSSFGPFGGQFLIGDQGQSKIMRMTMERVKGQLQGACYDFRQGFMSGVLRFAYSGSGDLYVGQTNRGWASTGKEPFGLERVRWTGQLPFEIKQCRATPDGFELELTRPCYTASAADVANFSVTRFNYHYHAAYGSPVNGLTPLPIAHAHVSPDGLRIRLVVDSLKQGDIHEVRAEGLVSVKGEPLLHNVAYYTLNNIPEGEKLAFTRKASFAPKLPETLLTAATRGRYQNDKATVARLKAMAGKVDPAVAGATDKAAATQTGSSAKPKTVLTLRQTAMPAAWGGKADVTLTISTKTGLKFDPATAEVRAGSKVQLVFTNPDDMLHNLVVVLPGQAVPVGEQAMKLGLRGQKLNYVPPGSDKVLAHTAVLQPQTSETIYFTAPTKPGAYSYVCTLPGHFYTMQGILKVK